MKLRNWTTPARVTLVLVMLALVGCGTSSDDDEGGSESARLGANDQGGAGNGAANDGDDSFSPSEGPSLGVAGSGAGTGSSGTGGASGFGNGLSAGVGAPAPQDQRSADGTADPADPNDSEKYTDVGVNPFVMVDHDPFSTFAADVDTASYDIFRRDINFGLAPQPYSVRVEDYVNNFVYDYDAPAPEDQHPFAISLAAAPHPVREGIALLRVGIQARLPADIAKKATNLVFLVDTSGSMQSEEKLPIVKRVLSQALGMLDPTDTVSIVTYASGTGVALEPTLAQDAATIDSVIQNLSTSGGTNGAGGINLAYEQAEAALRPGGINHVILCTDGDFNLGPSSDEELVALIEEKRETGVTLTALGFGIGNLNDSMMEKVSNAGNGIYSVISSVVQADAYVEDRLLATIEHVAKDVKLQLELNPEHVLAYRLLGYENRAIADEDFRDDVIDAGEIGAGHRVTALYELVMAGGEVPEIEGAPEVQDGEPVDGEREIAEADLVMVKVRYKLPGATTEDAAMEVSQALAPDAMLADFADADLDLSWAVSMAMLAEVLKQSPYAQGQADLDAIEAVVAEQADRDTYRTELAELLSVYRGLSSP